MRPALAALCCLALAAASAADGPRMRVAMASTLDDSGLGPALVAGFEQGHGCAVAAVAAPSARGLALLATGDVHAAVVHAPSQERAFLAGHPGHGHLPFAASAFVIAGPPADPAGIRGLDLVAALRTLHARQATFISRADGSGTHEAEQELWDIAGTSPAGAAWYREAGGHMGAVLWLAAQAGAHTLADTATLAALQARGLHLDALARATPDRPNPYAVIWPRHAAGCVQDFVAWLGSAASQDIITAHTVSGIRPFRPLP